MESYEREEEEAAAEEAGAIGGEPSAVGDELRDSEGLPADEAERPLAEAGGGEAEAEYGAPDESTKGPEEGAPPGPTPVRSACGRQRRLHRPLDGRIGFNREWRRHRGR